MPKKKYNLEYQDTYKYVVEDIIADRYAILGSDNKDACILLLPDDKIFAILKEPVCVLNIKTHSTQDEVKKAIIETLGNSIDFSQYDHWECRQSVPGGTEEGFGLYSFCWYNVKGDIIVNDMIRMVVSHNGEVDGLCIYSNANQSFDKAKDKLLIKDYDLAIKKKLETIYKHVKDYEVYSSVLVIYKNEYYISCTIGVDYYLDVDGDSYGEACRLLIKV